MVPDPNLNPEPETPATDGGSGGGGPRMWREVSLDSGEISVVPPNPTGVNDPPEVTE